MISSIWSSNISDVKNFPLITFINFFKNHALFNLKKRPSYNPLIIHYHDLKKTYNDIVFNENFLKLYKKFCPGPLTFILNKNKNSKIPKIPNITHLPKKHPTTEFIDITQILCCTSYLNY